MYSQATSNHNPSRQLKVVPPALLKRPISASAAISNIRTVQTIRPGKILFAEGDSADSVRSSGRTLRTL